MISKVINNKLVEQPRREVSGWDVPSTTEQEVAFALKVARLGKRAEMTRVLDALSAIGKDASWISTADFDRIIDRVGCTRKWLEGGIRNVNGWLANIRSYVGEFGEPDALGISKGRTFISGGLPTAVILAGDNIVLGPCAMAHLMISCGSSAIVKASSVEPLSPFLFLKALLDRGVPAPNFLCFDTSKQEEKELIRKIVSSSSQSVIYGDDRTVEAVYGGMNMPVTHKAVTFGTGRSGVIVLPDADLDLAARFIIHGAAEDRGNRCTSTKKVLAPQSVAKELEQLLVKYADALERGDPHDPRTDIGRLDPDARKAAEAAAGGSEILYDKDVILARCRSNDSQLLTDEFGYPVVGLRYYGAGEDPAELSNRLVANTPSGRATNISVMTKSVDEFKKVARATNAYKVQLNVSTTFSDLTSPHHGKHLFYELMRPRALLTPSA